MKFIFKEILLHKNSLLCKVENDVIKVEFQFRGSPHVHVAFTMEGILQKKNTIIAESLPEEMPDSNRLVILLSRAKLLKKVKMFIDGNLIKLLTISHSPL